MGVLLGANADDVEFQTWVGSFLQGLQQAGWSIGQNVQIDTHWATSDAAGIRKHAAELVALAPDVILAHGTSTVAPLLQLTRTVPIVAPVFGDPVGAGFVDSLARPGGNVTGFMSTEYSMAAKWLELLKETAPSVTRVAILRDASQGSGTSQFAAIATVAPALNVNVGPDYAVNREVRACSGWRPDRYGGRGIDPSSRPDRQTSGALQATHSLLRTRLRSCRWPDLLWTRLRRTVPPRGRLR
jgi:hypothetical protein